MASRWPARSPAVDAGTAAPGRRARRRRRDPRPRRSFAELHYRLRTEADSPLGSALSVALGTVIGCLPVYGLHLLLCAALAGALGLSRVKAYLAAHINNAATAPVLLWIEYSTGRWLTGAGWPHSTPGQISAAAVVSFGRDLLLGSLVVGPVLGVALGAAALAAGRRWRAAPAARRLLAEAADAYRSARILDWEIARGKLLHDPVYGGLLASGRLPASGRLVDLGCGRGLLLALLASARRRGELPAGRLELVGVERARRTAAIARRALAGQARIEVADLAAYRPPPAAAIVLIDVLHYLAAADQEALLERAAAVLQPAGVLFLREADAALPVRFTLTRTAERICALARGHLRQRFCYRTAAEWAALLAARGLRVEQRPMWAGTPYANRLLIATRR